MKFKVSRKEIYRAHKQLQDLIDQNTYCDFNELEGEPVEERCTHGFIGHCYWCEEENRVPEPNKKIDSLKQFIVDGTSMRAPNTEEIIDTLNDVIAAVNTLLDKQNHDNTR